MKTETTKHTPGPWKWNPTDCSIWSTGSNRRAPVAEIFTAKNPESQLSESGDTFSQEEEANARLVEAAPELLVALRGCKDAINAQAVEDVENGRPVSDLEILRWQKVIDIMMPAILRAEGGGQ